MTMRPNRISHGAFMNSTGSLTLPAKKGEAISQMTTKARAILVPVESALLPRTRTGV